MDPSSVIQMAVDLLQSLLGAAGGGSPLDAVTGGGSPLDAVTGGGSPLDAITGGEAPVGSDTPVEPLPVITDPALPPLPLPLPLP